MSTPAQVQALRSGEIDVGLLRLPADTTGSSSTTVRGGPRWRSCSPTRIRSRDGAEIPLRALAREPLILFPASPRPSWADTVVAACREAGFEPDRRAGGDGVGHRA